MKMVASLVIWGIAALMTLLVFFAVLFVMLFLLPFDRKRKIAHSQGFWWADAIIGLNPFWRFNISGLEHINPQKTYVVVANHQSLADIVMLYKTRMQFKWVAKDSLFKIPVFGWCMSRMKYIRLTRGKYSSVRDVYGEAANWLRRGVSVLFFPEGTRSIAPGMNNFKNGAFKLAIKEKKPILPVYIEGSRGVIPRGSWIFKSRASCRLVVLPEIDTAGFRAEDFARLRDNTYHMLSSEAAYS
ncbi:MAG: lysophospholipid acyltransferase family protein [Candidatus Omnitrophota bacterium]